jgi:hypothetical protein
MSVIVESNVEHIQTDRQTGRQTFTLAGWAEKRWINRQKDKQTNWIDRQANRLINRQLGQTDRKMDWWTDGQMDRWTDGQMDKQAYGQIDRQTGRLTDG